MIAYYPAAFGLAAHTLFWGCGISLLVMPRPWTRYWPVLAAPAGLALQSLVVWIAAYSGLPGTNAYAYWTEIVPIALLLVGLRRRAAAEVGRDLGRFSRLWLAMAFCLLALVTPLALASNFLTTSSLGSCDAADYAAGARTLMEFGRGDRTGFIGLSEVVSILSTDNFYDFWLRLNHFTPAALIALNGSIFQLEPFELTGLATAAFLVLSLPTVFWLARAGLRHNPGASLAIALIYGLGPITWYAVFHVAIGQLLAAQAIALLTWGGIALWNSGASGIACRRMFSVLAIGYALVLGSYNFIIVVCLIPAGAYALGLALQQNRWAALSRWAAALILPLLACGTVFASRVGGLSERFRLFRTYDFGWRIPELSPEGWFGAVARPSLESFPTWARVVLSAAFVAVFVYAVVRAIRDRRLVRPFLVLSLTVPVAAGYLYLVTRGRVLGTNASYDAYKLLSVFYPGFLAAICCWFALLGVAAARVRIAALALAAVVVACTANAAWRFGSAMSNPPLQVGPGLAAVRELEERTEVTSVNMLLPDMWSRLWANSFLLRKPQYFATHTYEGRLPTELRGDWDLLGPLVRVNIPGEETVGSDAFTLERARSSAIRVRLGAGWHGVEQDTASGRRWQWTENQAHIQVDNPSGAPVRTRWRFHSVGSLSPRRFILRSDGRELFAADTGPQQRDLLADLVMPPGRMTLEVTGDGAAASPGKGDSRVLGFQVFGIDIHVRHDR